MKEKRYLLEGSSLVSNFIDANRRTHEDKRHERSLKSGFSVYCQDQS